MSYNPASIRAAVTCVVRHNLRTTLQDVSVELGIDRHTVERAFADDGTTFRAVRSAMRLAAATELLSSSAPLSIKEIAVKTGFSQAAFSRFIESRTGFSPTKLRKQLGTCAPSFLR